MSQELAVSPSKKIKSLLEGPDFQAAVEKAIPSHLKPERFVRIALSAMTRTPKLYDCTPESLFRCLLDLSALGLEPDGRRAHLIPYGKECTLIIDYKGLAELAMRSGIVSNIHADVVCENDTFEYDRGELKKHAIDFRKARGAMFAAYALVRFKDGTEKCEVMNKDQIEVIRKRSRAGNAGPWKTDFDEMAKKTVFRRLSKWLPLSAEFRDALEKDDDELTDLRVEREAPKFQPRLDVGASNAIEDAISAAAEESQQPAPSLVQQVAALMAEHKIEWPAFARYMRETKIGDFDSLDEVPTAVLESAINGWAQIIQQLK